MKRSVPLPTMRVKVVLAASAVGVLSMFGLAAGAWAASPSVVHVSGSFSGDDPIADCGTFEVRDEFTLNFSGTEHYDREGNLVQVVEHVFGVDRLYNSVTGKSLKPASFSKGLGVPRRPTPVPRGRPRRVVRCPDVAPISTADTDPGPALIRNRQKGLSYELASNLRIEEPRAGGEAG